MKFFKKNWKKIVLIFLSLFLIFSTCYLIFAILLYKGIETNIRIVGCITLIDALILFILLLVKFKKKVISKAFIVISIIALIYSSTIAIVGYEVNSVYNILDSVTSDGIDKYSTSLVVRSDSPATGIDDIKNDKIAMYNYEEYYEAYDLAYAIVDENKLNRDNIVLYDTLEGLLSDLINGKINFALIPTNYASREYSQEGLDSLDEKTKIIYTKTDTKEKKLDQIKQEKSLDEPFTILIMGVDTVNDGFSSGFNGDALLLVTFNPTTTNATILSIPRDTYMPSCSGNRKIKITDAGWQGHKCIMTSLEKYFDIDIDYYVKINFNGVVQLVDAFGGVEIDVPYAFCEQNSKRQWGKNTIFVNSGKQLLNGEKALAFSRHRKVTNYMVNYCGSKYVTHANYWNDFTRGQNQQIVIKALLSKLKDINSYDKLKEILNTISKNFETDMSMNNIASLYKLAKNILKKASNTDEAFSMQKLYLSGEGAMIYSPSYKFNLYYYIAYEESKQAVINAMKQNLGEKPVIPIKKFSFSIKQKYEEYVIGKNIGSTFSLTLMPNLVGLSESQARALASKNGFNLTVNYVTGTFGQFIGQVLSQSVPVKTDLDSLSSKSVSVNVVESINTPSTQTPSIDENNSDDTVNDDTENNDNEDDDANNDDSEATGDNTSTDKNDGNNSNTDNNAKPNDPLADVVNP